jgi:hypothetical protein
MWNEPGHGGKAVDALFCTVRPIAKPKDQRHGFLHEVWTAACGFLDNTPHLQQSVAVAVFLQLKQRGDLVG